LRPALRALVASDDEFVVLRITRLEVFPEQVFADFKM
jgi:hypothetical protein